MLPELPDARIDTRNPIVPLPSFDDDGKQGVARQSPIPCAGYKRKKRGWIINRDAAVTKKFVPDNSFELDANHSVERHDEVAQHAVI
jgi:hypothetical protein